MANIFLNDGYDEIETAIMLEKAYVQDIGTSVAYTDGTRVFKTTICGLWSFAWMIA